MEQQQQPLPAHAGWSCGLDATQRMRFCKAILDCVRKASWRDAAESLRSPMSICTTTCSCRGSTGDAGAAAPMQTMGAANNGAEGHGALWS